MKFLQQLFFPTPLLKAVAAPASNGMDIFKRRTRTPFNPKITLGGFNY